jgi:hypothetical protein
VSTSSVTSLSATPSSSHRMIDGLIDLASGFHSMIRTVGREGPSFRQIILLHAFLAFLPGTPASVRARSLSPISNALPSGSRTNTMTSLTDQAGHCASTKLRQPRARGVGFRQRRAGRAALCINAANTYPIIKNREEPRRACDRCPLLNHCHSRQIPNGGSRLRRDAVKAADGRGITTVRLSRGA